MKSLYRIIDRPNVSREGMHPKFAGDAGGFTLLEVLIALVVLAVGVSLALSVISGSLGYIRKAQLRTRAVEYAQFIMESTLNREDPLEAETFTQDFEDGFQCTVYVEDYDPGIEEDPLLQSRTTLPVKLMQYTAEMIGPDSPAPVYQLQTLKIVKMTQDRRLPLLE